VRVLIVDDSRAIRIMLGRYLVDLGYTTAEAGNGKEALAVLAAGTLPDLMLVDWNMPEMNGYDFVTAVRADPKYEGIPIVMVTTETELAQVARAFENGANEYVMKPFTKDVLQSKLELLGFGPAR
jgi:two-component system, chemotaxis family, chemotaxis protein CheY